MTDAELVTKRRLPLWMSSSSSTTTTSRTSKRKESSTTSIEEDDDEEFVRAKPKRAGKELDTTADHAEEGKATRSRRKKRVGEKENENVVPQNPIKIKTKSRRRQQFSDGEDMPDPVLTQEDHSGELTVDDLISIAQEYVKADIEKGNHQKQQQGITRREERSKSGGQQTSSLESPEVLLPTTSTSMGCNSDQAVSLSQDSSTTTYKTGDPTQDMLDLYLGALLKKPTQTREVIKQSEAAACAAFAEEIVLDNYICSQKNKKPAEELRPLPVVTKKKSSLRDKVAMFLD